MEPSGMQNSEKDPAISTKRRLSSILKAPRTSMKVLQEDVQQEEITKPIEKRRNSRRVSFATTNNVHVFSKDVKSESPAVGLSNNVTVIGVDQQDKRLSPSQDGISQQDITGSESLSVAPLCVSYRKSGENFFENPVARGNFVDQTIVFGSDDVAYMDMTHCHTITIEKDDYDDDIHVPESCGGQQDILKPHTDQMPLRNLSTTGKSNIDRDFSAFLASLSQPSIPKESSKKPSALVQFNNVPSLPSKVGASDIFAQCDARTSGLDKENQPPAFLTKQIHCPSGSGLMQKNSNVLDHLTMSPEEDCMDLTKSHTHIIKNRGTLHPVLSGGLENQERVGPEGSDLLNDSCDMELTRSQTAMINLRTLGTANSLPSRTSRSRPSVLGPDMTLFNDSCDMELTRSQTAMINLKTHETVNSLTSNVSLSRPSAQDPNRTVFNDSCDMELTRSQTAMINFKTSETVNPLSSNVSLSRPSALGPDMTLFNDSCDMELTRSQTAMINLKTHETVNSLTSNVSLSRPSAQDPNRTVFSDSCDMELTRSQTAMINFKTSETVNPLSSNVSLSRPSALGPDMTLFNDSCDMELTRSQTAMINLKTHETVNSLTSNVSLSRPSAQDPNRTVFNDSCDMELTRSQTAMINFKTSEIVNPLVNKVSLSRPSTLDSNRTIFNDSCDMELTRSQTAMINFKTLETVHSLPNKASLSRPSALDPNSYVMEMTEALTGSIKLHGHPVSSREDNSQLSSVTQMAVPSDHPGPVELTRQTNTSGFIVYSGAEDMELTKCQTMPIDMKNVHTECASVIAGNGGAPEMSSRIFFGADSEGEQMEMTRALELPITEVKQCLPTEDRNPGKFICETKRMQDDDDMEITRSRTVMIDSKTCESLSLCNRRKSEGVTPPVLKNPMFLNGDQNTAKHVEVNITKESTQILPDHADKNALKEIACPSKNYSFTTPTVDDFATDSSQQDDQEAAKIIKSRQRSMTDLQLKLKNAACVVRESAEAATETALPPLQKSVLPETHVNDAGTSKISNAMEGEPAADKADAPESSANLTHHQSTMPKNHREKSLSARLSLGGFLPKLPSRSNPSNANQTQTRSSGLFESSLLNRGADVTREVNNSCMIDNLDDEVLPEVSSEEELSESVDSSLLKLTQERDSSPRELVSMEPEDDSVFEPATKTTQGLKRPFPEDDNEDLKAESKRKQSTSSIIEKGPDTHHGVVQWESSVSRVNSEEVPGRMTKNIEAVSSSSSSANLRYESTFESSYKYSQCDSQLDGTTDHEFDFKKKLDDGSITADEFLRHFGINFVIHRSRPSALPENLKSDQTRTMEDLLKEKYIYRPKQRVYETDCQKLTEMVEGLKTRISEQSHPMRSINVSLMRGMSELSKEELQSFGSKLKERKVYFRKRGKSLSHEMKEALYSELVKTTQEAQRNLREKIEEVDGILKDLDECINKLNADLAAKDVILTEDFPTNPDMMPALKTRQQELLNLNTAVAENERQIGELEVQKKATQDKLDLMRKDITGLQSDIRVLNRLNEWRLAERNDNRALFTYLHNTLEMELTFQNPLGKDKSGDAERNMDISFHLQLDGEKSQCFAVMVHKLLSQYIQADRKWAEKYPTAGHIPMLLHEVGLVVSRLRLLGEEIHRMKKWGALRLDILELTCVDTLVHIMFSSLKAFVKFEVTLAVTSDYPLSRPQLQTFVNLIGNTRSDQVDKIISSTAPSKNCLTKIVKRIHDELLC